MIRRTCLTALGLAAFLVANEAQAQLKGWWKFDSNPPLVDEVGSNDGMLIGGATLGPGIVGTAVKGVPVSDGMGGFVAASGADFPGTETSLAVGTGNQTISVWLNYSGEQPTGVGTPGTPNFIPLGAVAGQGYIGGGPGMGIFVVGATENPSVPEQVDHIQVQTITPGATGLRQASTTKSINDGQWHHVVGVYERGKVDGVRLYIDGELQPPTAHHSGDLTNATGNVRDQFSHFNVATSSCCGAGGYAWPLNGSVDEVQIYGIALTQDQINFLYQNPGQAIPEPTAMVLLGIGGLALLLCKRRLRNAALGG